MTILKLVFQVEPLVRAKEPLEICRTKDKGGGTH